MVVKCRLYYLSVCGLGPVFLLSDGRPCPAFTELVGGDGKKPWCEQERKMHTGEMPVGLGLGLHAMCSGTAKPRIAENRLMSSEKRKQF